MAGGADNTIENMSEMSGERFGAVGRFFGARNLTAAALRATGKEVRQMLYSTSQFLNRAVSTVISERSARSIMASCGAR